MPDKITYLHNYTLLHMPDRACNQEPASTYSSVTIIVIVLFVSETFDFLQLTCLFQQADYDLAVARRSSVIGWIPIIYRQKSILENNLSFAWQKDLTLVPLLRILSK